MYESLERNRQLHDNAAELVQERNILAGKLEKLRGEYELQLANNKRMTAEVEGLRQSLQVGRCLTLHTVLFRIGPCRPANNVASKNGIQRAEFLKLMRVSSTLTNANVIDFSSAHQKNLVRSESIMFAWVHLH